MDVAKWSSRSLMHNTFWCDWSVWLQFAWSHWGLCNRLHAPHALMSIFRVPESVNSCILWEYLEFKPLRDSCLESCWCQCIWVLIHFLLSGIVKVIGVWISSCATCFWRQWRPWCGLTGLPSIRTYACTYTCMWVKLELRLICHEWVRPYSRVIETNIQYHNLNIQYHNLMIWP